MNWHINRLAAKWFLAANILVVLLPAGVSAHQTGFNGAMAATLHFSPNDSPLSGQSTSISLIELKYQGATFDPENCDCRLEITSSGKSLATSQLSFSGRDLNTHYNFPSKGTYELIFKGAPRTAGTFTSFQIHFTENIERAAIAPTNPIENLFLLGALAAIIILAVVMAIIFLRPTPLNGKVQE